MKKLLIISLFCLLLMGCSNSNNIEQLDISSASKALDSKYGNMVKIGENELSVIYGLDLSLFKEYEIKSSQSANGDFYALIKIDSKDKKEVQQMMKKMFEVLEKQSSLYTPEAVLLFENHLATSVGDYLIYLTGDKPSDYYEVVKEYIN